MSEQLNEDNSAGSHPSESEILTLVRRMQQQMVFLERKIDLLVNQSQERPFREKEKHFPKPSPSYGSPYRSDYRRDKRSQGEAPREGNYKSGQYFGYQSKGEPRGYDGPRKDYGNDRENSSGKDRHFKKKYEGKRSGFDPRKKKFFQK